MSETPERNGGDQARRQTLTPDDPRPLPPTDGLTEGQNGSRPDNGVRAEGLEASSQKLVPHAPPTAPAKRPTLDALLKLVRGYNPNIDVEPLRKAYAYAEAAHKGQRRSTGEPYITHPRNAALIRAEMRLDTEPLPA